MVSKNITRRQRLSQTFYYMTSCVLVSMSSTLILSSVSPASQPWNCNSFQAVEAFTSPPHNHRHPFGQSSFATTTAGARTHLFSSPTTEDTSETNPEELHVDHSPTDCPTVVRAPLKFIGPYPCLALRFPNLATESQRSRNITGISLDFVMDTAANVNTVQSQVAQELLLPKQEDSPALPGVSSSGPMDGGDTYVLGDSQLEQAAIMVLDNLREQTEEERKQQQQEPFEFMQNLTAAALPVVNPGSAGLLGLAFFYCFEGGVEFRWGSTQQQPQLVDGMIVPTDFRDDSSPSVTFYGEDDSSNSDSLLQRALSDLVRVPIETIPVTQLPSLKIKVNGVEVMALLDTGSPVTVLNQGAAQAAGIQTTQDTAKAAAAQTNSAGGWKNPFSSVVDKFKEAQATAEAAAKGEILMIGGSDGKPVTLYRSASDHHPSISVATGLGGDDLSFGSDLPVYVGDIPGLAALNGIGVDSPPAVVLGLDVLRKRPRMLFRPRENEVYF
ncbi:unnamed protein product [Pseudo-nitzschia multistriata]|uniref:Peptidase A2 domain-containing protein n=1 Tax=Pseudo-nitzschia multistriata TaxID=183589 RepID=A0A448YVL3_9STRA|nr:unnamed protein product [Pseudo-nitzschia multistriata]